MISRILFRDRPREDLFTRRGPETSRIEGFSDAAFGFAITLLVVSLEVPRSSAELLRVLQGFAGFAITFGILFSLWKAQFTFFRRYGLEDGTTINLTGVFLFLVMFSVYPLKFLISGIVDVFLGRPDATFVAKLDAAWLFFAYGLGFSGIFATLALMYGHAYRLRERLGLSPLEVFETVQSIRRYAVQALSAILLLSFPVIFSLPYATRQNVAMPLFTATALAVALAGRRYRVRARKQRAELAAAVAHPV
jgi:hypothetical protein